MKSWGPARVDSGYSVRTSSHHWAQTAAEEKVRIYGGEGAKSLCRPFVNVILVTKLQRQYRDWVEYVEKGIPSAHTHRISSRCIPSHRAVVVTSNPEAWEACSAACVYSYRSS
jgi:hypothetical protein